MHALVRLGATDPGKRQQIVDQRAHPLRRFEDHRHLSLALSSSARPGTFLEQLGEPGDVTNGRAQVMRDRIGKGFQFPVDGFELGRSCREFIVQDANLARLLGSFRHLFRKLVAGLQKLSLDPPTNGAEPRKKRRE